jgi:hypothetical protein
MKKLRVWDGASAESSDIIFNEIIAYGARFIKSVNAYPFSQAAPCGYTLVFDPTNIKPEDKTYLSLTRGYRF